MYICICICQSYDQVNVYLDEQTLHLLRDRPTLVIDKRQLLRTCYTSTNRRVYLLRDRQKSVVKKNKCYVYVLHRRTDVVSLKGSSKVRDQIKETSARKQLLDLDEPTIVSLRDRGKSETKRYL